MAELRARLAEAIGALGEQERVVTTFYFYEGLTLREIGGALNLTEGGTSQILHRGAREAQRGALGGRRAPWRVVKPGAIRSPDTLVLTSAGLVKRLHAGLQGLNATTCP